MSSLRTYLTCLKHLIVLNKRIVTFLENSNCLDVACQYYKVPSVWVAITACLICLSSGFLANPLTGESDPLSIY